MEKWEKSAVEQILKWSISYYNAIISKYFIAWYANLFVSPDPYITWFLFCRRYAGFVAV